MTGTEYVVTATQLNTYDDDKKDFGKVARGTVFTVGDVVGEDGGSQVTVTEAMVNRWLKMRPPVIADKEARDAAQAIPAAAADRIAELEAEVQRLRSGGDPAEAPGADGGDAETQIDKGTGDPGGMTAPAKNASRDLWAEYAKDKAPEDAAYIDDPNVTRDDLVKKYGA